MDEANDERDAMKLSELKVIEHRVGKQAARERQKDLLRGSPPRPRPPSRPRDGAMRRPSTAKVVLQAAPAAAAPGATPSSASVAEGESARAQPPSMAEPRAFVAAPAVAPVRGSGKQLSPPKAKRRGADGGSLSARPGGRRTLLSASRGGASSSLSSRPQTAPTKEMSVSMSSAPSGTYIARHR